jgi:hypothetical protein
VVRRLVLVWGLSETPQTLRARHDSRAFYCAAKIEPKLGTLTVSDATEANSEAPGIATETVENSVPLTVANDPSKRWRGGKGSSVRMDERMNFAYAAMLEGGTRRQVLQKVMDRFGVSEVTAGRDYSAAMQILKTEQIETRENLLNQIQALRLATVQKALRKGQLQTVAMLLKDMGAVIGEAAPEQQAAAAPTLNITVEDKRQA